MFYNFNDHTTDMDPGALACMNNFLGKYDCAASYHMTSKDKKKVLSANTEGCRFCGKKKPEVTFKKDAHAIPHTTGNRWLFSDFECDECNAHFGRLLENEFGNFMHLNHTMSAVKGKTGRNKFVQKKEGISIINDGAHLDWKGVPDENINYDQDAGVLTVTQKMPGYVPVAVYKTLIKIALTIMPEEELANFSDTSEWINEHSHTETRFPFERLWMVHGTFDSSTRWDQLSVVLSKRKNPGSTELPYMLFNLNYANFDFQLPVPLCSKDITTEFEPSMITYLPHLYDLKYGLGKINLVGHNLRGRETVRGQEMTFIMKDLDGTGTVTRARED